MVSVVGRLTIRGGDRLRNGLLAVFALMAGGGFAAVLWRFAHGQDLSPVSDLAGALAPMCGGGALIWRLLRKPRAGTETIDAAAHDLAGKVLAQQTDRRELFIAGGDSPIDVAFRNLPDPGRIAENAEATGRLNQIRSYYERLRPRRLVIVGVPGSGKTFLAMELIISLLRDRNTADRVPCLISLSSWDPETKFEEWVAERVKTAYDIPLSLADALVKNGRLLPVLDGLDEMDGTGQPPARSAAALRRLNSYRGPLVMTCRADEYQSMRRNDARLEYCAVVQIRKISARKSRRYLLDRAFDRAQWREVLDDITSARSGALAGTLTTPWLLFLAAEVSQAAGGPSLLREFVGRAAEPATRAALEAGLLERFVPAVITLHPQPDGTSYEEEAVIAWCVLLARFLRDTGSRELAGRVMSGTDIIVHQLWPIAGLRTPRVATAALTLVLWLPFLAATSVLLGHNGYFPFPGLWVVASVAVMPLVAGWGGLGHWLQPRQIVFSRIRHPKGAERLLLSLLVAACLGVEGSLVFGTGFGAAFGIGFALVHGLGLATAVRWDIHLLAAFAASFLTAFVFGIATGALGGGYGASAGLPCGLAAGCVSLFVAVRVGIWLAARRGGGLPDGQPGFPNPRTALHDDFVAGNIAGLISGALAFLLAWRAPWLAAPLPLAVLFGATAYLSAGPGFVAETSRRYAATLFAARGRLPWRLLAFLDWAHQAGILRVAATAYQFRHRRLQDWLAR